jgi:RNA polymerase-binding transcription factor DksA
MMMRMHYHYFTLEQRDALAQAIRARITEPGMATALERLRAPQYGVCESCGGDIAFRSLLSNPRLYRCARCLDGLCVSAQVSS